MYYWIRKYFNINNILIINILKIYYAKHNIAFPNLPLFSSFCFVF